jgi:hypothetical protein|nr:amidohydrolase family protein [Nocardioides sp.]
MGKTLRAGHLALHPVLDIGAAQGWAFTFHQDASSAGRSGGREYVDEMTRMLASHPHVPQVWAHAGCSRRVRPDDHVDLVTQLVEKHTNLHIDLSWVLFDEVVEAGMAHPGWVELVARHPDRFMIGSDAFGDLAGHHASLERWSALTDRLTPAASALVESDNARRLWWR